jgi:uncharacterized membrane protein YuzA (DUF378 family)
MADFIEHTTIITERSDYMDTLSLILLIIGALNWGLIGIFQFDLVAAIFGGMSTVVSRIIYTIVGLAGIWGITLLFRRDGVVHSDRD